MMDKLKPCPFCGNGAWERIAYDTWKKKPMFTVQCKKVQCSAEICKQESGCESMEQEGERWQ